MLLVVSMKLFINDPQKTQKCSILFKNLKLFTDSITFRFSNEKMHIQTLDNGQCCLLDTHIKNTWFTEFVIDPNDIRVV